MTAVLRAFDHFVCCCGCTPPAMLSSLLLYKMNVSARPEIRDTPVPGNHLYYRSI